MFRVPFRVTYIYADMLPHMCCVIFPISAASMRYVLFVRPASLVCLIPLLLLWCVDLQRTFLSFVSRSFLCYMEYVVSLAMRPSVSASCLCHVQLLCWENTCSRLLSLVSILGAFLLFVHLGFSYFRSAFRYSRSFLVYNITSFVLGTVHRDIDCTEDIVPISLPYGGGHQHIFMFDDIAPYVVRGDAGSTENSFCFVVHGNHITPSKFCSETFVHTNIPLRDIIRHLSVRSIMNIAKVHGIKTSLHVPKSVMVSYFDAYHCAACNNAVTIFSIVGSKHVFDRNRKQKYRKNTSLEAKSSGMSGNNGKSIQQGDLLQFQSREEKQKTSLRVKATCRDTNRSGKKQSKVNLTDTTLTMPPFPPLPPDDRLLCDIARDFCLDSSHDKMQEAGCAVCGQLCPVVKLSKLKSVKQYLHILQAHEITRIERKDLSKPIQEYRGPVLDYGCNCICDDCRQQLRNGRVPWNALAKGLWIGTVPDELSNLKFMERLLIAHVCVNSCFVHVAASGLRKMTSHVIAFESPVPKVYHRLPPPVEDLEEILAILFTGPCSPTDKDYQCTPLLVRRSYVARHLNG